MLTKVWCLIIGGVLMTMGATRCIPDVTDAWEIVVVLGFCTLAFGIVQTVWDYGKPKGWFG